VTEIWATRMFLISLKKLIFFGALHHLPGAGFNRCGMA
jgi:hypothetical protein